MTPANEVLGFFKYLDVHIESGLEVHVVLDKPSVRKNPAIKARVEHGNDNPTPFIWCKPVQDITTKVGRG